MANNRTNNNRNRRDGGVGGIGPREVPPSAPRPPRAGAPKPRGLGAVDMIPPDMAPMRIRMESEVNDSLIRLIEGDPNYIRDILSSGVVELDEEGDEQEFNVVGKFKVAQDDGTPIVYNKGDVVYYKDKTYIAIEETSGFSPRHEHGGWRIVSLDNTLDGGEFK